jgi:hypothetical protein
MLSSSSFNKGTNLRFKLWVYRNAHCRTMFPTLMLILRLAKHTFQLKSRLIGHVVLAKFRFSGNRGGLNGSTQH